MPVNQSASYQSPLPTPDDVDWSAVDFLDFGCSNGGSVSYCSNRFGGGQGIGIDIDEAKVRSALTSGVSAVHGDAAHIDLAHQVRFVSMMHFLEHLPTFDSVRDALRSASLLATDFIYIRHPSFEGEGYLNSCELRQYWWDWSGHPTHITINDYCGLFDELGLHPYTIRYLYPVKDSSHPSILPSSAPRNQHEYDPDSHTPKPRFQFPSPLWEQQEIFIALRGFSREEWLALTAP